MYLWTPEDWPFSGVVTPAHIGIYIGNKYEQRVLSVSAVDYRKKMILKFLRDPDSVVLRWVA